MTSADDGPRKLAASLDRMLSHMDAPNPDLLRAVFVQWPEIVGADLAAHARPSAIDGQTLVVTADDPTWASQLRWLENQLVDSIERASGSSRVKSIKVRVEPRGSSPSHR